MQDISLLKAEMRSAEIFSQTGILSENTLREPTPDEREELWDITRIFLKRIYQLDLIDKKSKEEQDECNKLSHYCVVMLHWNDIFDPPHYLNPAPQGRFRRDTLALALCIFTRISRNYPEYTKIKNRFILPHRWGSFLMWVPVNMRECNQDNIFHYFDKEKIEKLTEGKYKDVKSFAAAAQKGSVDARMNDDWYDTVSVDDPTYLIFWKLWKELVQKTRKPYKFALNYIWMNEEMGGVDLLSEDRDMNKDFLQKKIEEEAFPESWDLGSDVVYLMLYLSLYVDEEAVEEEKDELERILFESFYEGSVNEKKKNPWDAVISSKSIRSVDGMNEKGEWDDTFMVDYGTVMGLVKSDQEKSENNNESTSGTTADIKIYASAKDRAALVVENIRASVISYYNGDVDKTNEYLSFILKQLQSVAYADEILDVREYDFINEVQASWGINLKIWDDDSIKQMDQAKSSSPSEEKETPAEEKETPAEEKETPAEEESTGSEYLENYPGEFYTENERWDFGEYANDYPLDATTPFANVFEDGKYKYKDLFRRFTQDEVDAIVSKIEEKKTCITLPFVRRILEKKFDIRGLKDPFWFDPFIIHGCDKAGLLYFEQNGMMMNYVYEDQYGDDTLPTTLNNVAHVDSIETLSVAKGYNGYFEEYLPENADEDIVTALRMDWFNPNSGNRGQANLIQTNGKEYASTLPIVEAIWEYGWKPIVEKSKGSSQFYLSGISEWERFQSWDELLEWAFSDEEETGQTESSDTESSSSIEKSDKFSFEDYINTYKEEHPKDEQDENLLRATVDFLYETVDGTDGLLEVCSRTGGYSTYANNKLKNGKFAQVRWGKSDRKEGKPVRYFVDLYLLKSKMNYKIDSLPNQSLQSPHAHEFYVVRLYSQDDLENNKDILEERIKSSLKARQKNKLITKRKNLSRKQKKLEYLKDLGL